MYDIFSLYSTVIQIVELMFLVFYFVGDSTSGQRAIYQIVTSGIPIYNVNNNCSTGSTALLLAKQFIESGQSDCVLALGFEKMETGSLTLKVNLAFILYK